MRSRELFVVLLRHGIAEERGAKDDFDRRLTETGSSKMKQIARALARIVPDADTIYSSPLVRCVETAERLAKAYDPALRITDADALKPEATVVEFRELLSRTGGENIICVGHEPNLSTIMLDVTGMASSSQVALKKGGCYGLRFSARSNAQLEWMLPPRVLIGGA